MVPWGPIEPYYGRTCGDLLSGYQSPPGRLKTLLDRTMQGPQAVVDTFVLDPLGPLQGGRKAVWLFPILTNSSSINNRSPRPCPGVKCYRICRGHAQALHVMYMLLRREDYLNVMVHVCDSFLKDKRLTLSHVGSTHQTLREACHRHSKKSDLLDL